METDILDFENFNPELEAGQTRLMMEGIQSVAAPAAPVNAFEGLTDYKGRAFDPALHQKAASPPPASPPQRA